MSSKAPLAQMMAAVDAVTDLKLSVIRGAHYVLARQNPGGLIANSVLPLNLAVKELLGKCTLILGIFEGLRAFKTLGPPDWSFYCAWCFGVILVGLICLTILPFFEEWRTEVARKYESVSPLRRSLYDVALFIGGLVLWHISDSPFEEIFTMGYPASVLTLYVLGKLVPGFKGTQ